MSPIIRLIVSVLTLLVLLYWAWGGFRIYKAATHGRANDPETLHRIHEDTPVEQPKPVVSWERMYYGRPLHEDVLNPKIPQKDRMMGRFVEADDPIDGFAEPGMPQRRGPAMYPWEIDGMSFNQMMNELTDDDDER